MSLFKKEKGKKKKEKKRVNNMQNAVCLNLYVFS